MKMILEDVELILRNIWKLILQKLYLSNYHATNIFSPFNLFPSRTCD